MPVKVTLTGWHIGQDQNIVCTRITIKIVNPFIIAAALTAGKVYHLNGHFQAQLLLLMPRRGWNQTEHCLDYQLMKRREVTLGRGDQNAFLRQYRNENGCHCLRVEEHFVPESLQDSSRWTDFGLAFLGLGLGFPSPCSSKICCCFLLRYSCLMSSRRAFSSSFRILSSSALRLKNQILFCFCSFPFLLYKYISFYFKILGGGSD